VGQWDISAGVDVFTENKENKYKNRKPDGNGRDTGEGGLRATLAAQRVETKKGEQKR